MPFLETPVFLLGHLERLKCACPSIFVLITVVTYISSSSIQPCIASSRHCLVRSFVRFACFKMNVASLFTLFLTRCSEDIGLAFLYLLSTLFKVFVCCFVTDPLSRRPNSEDPG